MLQARTSRAAAFNTCGTRRRPISGCCSRMSGLHQRRPAKCSGSPDGVGGVGLTAADPKAAPIDSTLDATDDISQVKDTHSPLSSLTPPTQEPVQDAPPASNLPEGWKGLGYWLATTDRDTVEATLRGIRDDFMKQHTQSKADGTYASQNGNSTQAGSSNISSSEQHLLRQAVCRDAVMYGEMVQAVYDTLQTKDEFSRFNGYCAPNAMRPGKSLGDPAVGKLTTLGDDAKEYTVLKQIEADSGAYKLVIKTARNYVGFIAESQPDPDDGGVDIAIVYRGTITKDDWLQDAKAMKVRWRNGEQPAPPPDVTITALPFYSHFSTAVSVSIGTFVMLTSTVSDGPINAVRKLGGSLTGWCSAQQVQPYKGLCALFGLLGSVWEHTLGAFSYLFYGILGVNGKVVDTQLLGGSVMAGLAVYIGWGILSAKLDKPNEWWDNVKKLFGAFDLWVKYGTITWRDSLFGEPHSDPRVSFGFKEMYCDALMYPDPTQDQGCAILERATIKTSGADDGQEKDLPPPPRLTVYQTLTEVLNKYDTVMAGEPWVRSITVTGHSLGGALASICGFDLATKIAEATGARDEDTSENDPELDDDYTATREAHNAFVAAIKKLGDNQVPVPKVAVVSFAAPRVGDTNYAKAMGHHTLMSPWSVLEPYRSGFWNKVSVRIRDRFFQAIKMPWYWVALRQMQQQYAKPGPDAFGRAPTAEELAAGAGATDGGDGSQAAAAQSGPGVGMLRLVNTHDIVTKLPTALPFPGFYYVHGGYELLFNSYAVSYFKKGWWGAEIGNRHNMEMYLHLLDSSRDKALVNKSADLLVKQEQIPGCWWDPIRHKGLKHRVGDDAPRGRWYGPRKPVRGAWRAPGSAAVQGGLANTPAAVQQEQPSTAHGANYSKMK